jgi:predicted DNA-binding transcriptional regulator AlpA
MDETTTPDSRRHVEFSEPLTLLRPWSKSDVCAWLGVSENTLDKLIDEAAFPAPTHLGGSRRLPRWRFAEVDRWWQAQAEATRPAQTTAVTASSGGPVHTPGAGKRFGVVDRQRHKASR